MGKVILRIGIGLVGLLLVLALVVYGISAVRWDRDYGSFDVPVETVPIPTDDAAIARGEHIATTRYCANCHGDNLAGDYLLDEPILAVVPAPNLTPGEGGIGAGNTDADWIRAIRHGVGHDGRGLIGMPSRIWRQMSDEDLGALIAYLRTVPPVDNVLPERRVGPLFRVLMVLGRAPASEAAVIDHQAPRAPAPAPGVTVAYGEYLAQGCMACHGANLNGGAIRDLEGEMVVALNLTPGGDLREWSEADFLHAMRAGVTPTGRQLDEAMPWPYLGRMTDEELQAIWLYLRSLPALEQGADRTDI